MTAVSLRPWSKSEQVAIREQLDRILSSGPFHQSRRRRRFLEYIVNETLAGRSEQLKGYNIALEVFDRPETFDPHLDPIVRIEAARLRDRLREYYEADGQNDTIRIDLPKGTYTPQIEFREFCCKSSARPIVFNCGWTVGSLAGPCLCSAPLWQEVSRIFSSLENSGFACAARRVRHLDVVGSIAPLTEKASIAVLPFKNTGNDFKWDSFADGITEDIVTDLSHSKDLFVVARNSTEVYRDKPTDIRTVGRDLGVRYVLEGSIQSTDDRIRVTAQLIDARTGGHVWSSGYGGSALAGRTDVGQGVRLVSPKLLDLFVA